MRKKLSVFVMALAGTALLAGCGSNTTTATDTTTETTTEATTEAAPAEDTTAEAEAPAQTTEDNGTVSTDGSTSMEKVIGALGESFMAQNDGVTFTYNPTGSGSGITAVEEGRCDIGLSSRNLKDEEVAKGLTQTVLAYDGIAIIVNPENPVADLDIDTIARIYKGEIKNWSEVGGNDAEIVLIGREAGSGTRDGFESITGTEDACAYRQELTSTGDVITTVAQNPDAIGYASLASVKDSVKALSVGGVVPTEGYRKRRFLRHPASIRTGNQRWCDIIRNCPEVLRLHHFC